MTSHNQVQCTANRNNNNFQQQQYSTSNRKRQTERQTDKGTKSKKEGKEKKKEKKKDQTDLKWFGLLMDFEMTLEMSARHKRKATLRLRAHKGTFTSVGHQVPLHQCNENASQQTETTMAKEESKWLQTLRCDCRMKLLSQPGSGHTIGRWASEDKKTSIKNCLSQKEKSLQRARYLSCVSAQVLFKPPRFRIGLVTSWVWAAVHYRLFHLLLFPIPTSFILLCLHLHHDPYFTRIK